LEIGTNLSGLNYYSTELPFRDGFKSSKEWWTQTDTTFDTQESNLLNIDENGWVKSLPAPEDEPQYTSVGTTFYQGNRSYGYRGGQYVVLYDREGTIEYQFDAKKNLAASIPGRDVLDVTPSNNGIFVKIKATDPNGTGNYLQNIRVVPIANESNDREEIFNHTFIKKIDPFPVVRFMESMATNDSTQMN
jgi:hypothetical protein